MLPKNLDGSGKKTSLLLLGESSSYFHIADKWKPSEGSYVISCRALVSWLLLPAALPALRYVAQKQNPLPSLTVARLSLVLLKIGSIFLGSAFSPIAAFLGKSWYCH